MMQYIQFSLLFIIAHTVCYVLAGIIDLQLAGHIYEGKERLYKAFYRDMDAPNEKARVAKLMIPSQLVRGLLMSLVLYPILPFLQNLSFGLQFLFMSSLMFIYADFASAVPFSNTIEGLVYLKKEYVTRKVFWTIQLESVVYSVLFGLLAAWLII